MSDSLDFRIVIPARFASTRLPGKPLADINGRPMIEHVYQRACQIGASEVLIATDDTRIEEAAIGFGAPVVMTSNDHPTGTDRLAEVAKLRGWGDDDIIVNLQGDEPLTPPAILLQVARNLRDNPQAGIATLCVRIDDAGELLDPHKVKVVRDARGFALYFSRAPIPWERDVLDVESDQLARAWRHIGIYAYRAAFLHEYAQMQPCQLESLEKLEQLRAMWYGVRIHVDEAQTVPGPGVDTASDLAQVAALLAREVEN
jgi:3-deoxy-manno-octulosonate cytidylyltransferase (CMP-KDO synthetase)